MSAAGLTGELLRPRDTAKPLPESGAHRRARPEGRRVGAVLPLDLYVRFKTYVAQHGVSGEAVIIAAVEAAIGAAPATA